MLKFKLLLLTLLLSTCSCGGIKYAHSQDESTQAVGFIATSILVGQPERGKGTSLGVHIDAIALEKKDGRILYANNVVKSRQLESAYDKTPPEAVLGEPDSRSGCRPEQTFHLKWTGFVAVSFFNSENMIEKISSGDKVHVYLATDSGELCARSEFNYEVLAISEQDDVVFLCTSTRSTTCSMKDGVLTERSAHAYIDYSEPTETVVSDPGFVADPDSAP